MKTIFLGILVIAPCTLILNESDYIIVNLIGFAYIALMFFLSKKSYRMKRFFKDLYTEVEMFNEIKIF